MASNFSANQYDRAFSAKSLCNWQVPHWYPKHPRKRTQTTEFIANERGHLLPHVQRPKSSPWGHFKGTYELPNIITRDYANELSAPQIGNSRWTMPDPNRRFALKIKDMKREKEERVGDKEIDGTDSSEVMRSITPYEKETFEQDEEQQQSFKRVFNEKEKLNDPIAIAKGSRRSIRHETLERDNDLH